MESDIKNNSETEVKPEPAYSQALSIFIISIFIFVIGFFLYYLANLTGGPQKQEAVNQEDVLASQNVLGTRQNDEKPVYKQAKALPKRLEVEDVYIDLSVTEGSIKDGVWDIPKEGAAHLDKSGKPGDGGNTVIYGHNWKNIFAPLPRVKTGSKVRVTTEDGKIYTYKIYETKEVSPDDVSIALNTPSETLTLYTCDGVGDATRFVARAKPVEDGTFVQNTDDDAFKSALKPNQQASNVDLSYVYSAEKNDTALSLARRAILEYTAAKKIAIDDKALELAAKRLSAKYSSNKIGPGFKAAFAQSEIQFALSGK